MEMEGILGLSDVAPLAKLGIALAGAALAIWFLRFRWGAPSELRPTLIFLGLIAAGRRPGWVDWNQYSILFCLASITFNPLVWNIVARDEFHNKTLTRAFGSPKLGCYFLAFMIFTFGLLRDNLYHLALSSQPDQPLLPSDSPFYLHITLPVILGVVGQTLVLTSTYALGITGTFLGDYFGILMDHRVEGFPFNVLENPMYVGSTMCFAATALWYEKPAGLFITAYVYLCYDIALRFEGPFTTMIYETREDSKKQS